MYHFRILIGVLDTQIIDSPYLILQLNLPGKKREKFLTEIELSNFVRPKYLTHGLISKDLHDSGRINNVESRNYVFYTALVTFKPNRRNCEPNQIAKSSTELCRPFNFNQFEKKILGDNRVLENIAFLATDYLSSSYPM